MNSFQGAPAHHGSGRISSDSGAASIASSNGSSTSSSSSYPSFRGFTLKVPRVSSGKNQSPKNHVGGQFQTRQARRLQPVLHSQRCPQGCCVEGRIRRPNFDRQQDSKLQPKKVTQTSGKKKLKKGKLKEITATDYWASFIKRANLKGEKN
eukprot:GHVT01031890.1.p1 GENE.GHVT01031890.1~~GHVT01031890.1.p1  ORF type:complete len:151 (-),score=19.88 GHVT01031890.1:12-464(-)